LIRRTLAVMLFLLLPLCLQAQLDTQPTGLFLTATQHEGSIRLQSHYDRPVVAAITFRTKPDADPGRSCVSWLSPGANELTISPGATAQFSVSVRIPNKTADGEYHADAVVLTDGEDAGATGVHIPVHVRVGEVYSDVKLANVGAERMEQEVVFRFHLTQLGNAAYRGNLALRLENGSGREVHAQNRTVDIYGKGTVQLTLPSSQIPKGRYRVFMNFNSDRTDLGTQALPVLPKKYTIDINMP